MFFSSLKVNGFNRIAVAYSEPSQPSKLERFVKLVIGLQPLTIFAKRSILDVWPNSEYASEQY